MRKKRFLSIFCGILFASVLTAQTTFTFGGLEYKTLMATAVEVSNQSIYLQGDVVIPSSVTDSNSGNTYSVIAIGTDAFANCDSVNSITIPSSVTFIKDRAFYGCKRMTSISIPESVTSIGMSVFHNCRSLGSISIPSSITSITTSMFYGCRSLTSIDIPTGVTAIGEGAFYDCRSLTSVSIPSGVARIGKDAFYACMALTSVSIPESVTYIGDFAFMDCAALTSVTFPSGIDTIGTGAFEGCMALTSVVCKATIPPAIYFGTHYNTTFDGIDEECALLVPCGSLNAYEESDWSDFFYEEYISEDGLPFTLFASANDTTLGSVAISEDVNCPDRILTAASTACSRFVSWNDGCTENPRMLTVTCDTVFTATFESLVQYTEIFDTICEGSIYMENGFNAVATGVYRDTIQMANGCDSIVTLNLMVNPVWHDTINRAICEGSSYVDENFNVSEAGMYSHILQTADGCDSIITLNLTINPVFHDMITASICDGTIYAENGFIANEAGTYIQNLRTINGCDSIVTLNLTVNSLADTTITVSICEGTNYTENGFDVSKAGVHTLNLQTVNGCDSIVTLNLIVKPVYN